MRSVLKQIKLAEAVETYRDGFFKERLGFDADETVWLRTPWSRPNIHRVKEADEFMRFQQKPEEDPERVEFVRKKNLESTVWCIARWNVRDENGDPMPQPDVNDITGTWDTLSYEQQRFFEVLIEENFYPQIVKELNEAETADPNSEPATAPTASTAPSSEPSNGNG